MQTTLDAAGHSSQAQSPRQLLREGPSLNAQSPSVQTKEAENANAATAAADLQKLQLAAQADPSDENLFNLGNALLLHESIQNAIEVLQKGVGLYPNSPRMYIELGIGLYSRGSCDAAIETLCRASDLDPADPRPYIHLGKINRFTPSHADEVAKRMKRFIATNPNNPLAYY